MSFNANEDLPVDPVTGKKDYSELQKDQMLKRILIEQMVMEEVNLSNYKFERDRPELNAVVHFKEDKDGESPIMRLDCVCAVTPKVLFDILKDNDNMPNWLKNICSVNT